MRLCIYPLREMCLNTEFFLVRIFPHLNWIRENTGQKNLRNILKDFDADIKTEFK